MALFPKPEETQHVGLFHLNKRLNRILIGVAIFLLVLFGLFWRRRYAQASPAWPTLGFNESSGYYPYVTFSDYYPVSVDPADKSTADLCATFPKHLLGLVQPVLKIGHSEDRAKLEAQLDSVSACFRPDELLIFSDLEERIRNHTAIDILANLPARYYDREYNPDIGHYLLQKELKLNGTLDRDKEATKLVNGWIIDRFKFLPQIERAWLLRPDRPFYFFYETDTYVVWDNVYRFLSTFDPDTPVYMGSPSPGRHDDDRDVRTWFANGGPGFALSRAAVKALVRRGTAPYGQYNGPSVTEEWLPLLKDECCGDSVVGWTLWNNGVALQGYWPMFNPHPLHGIPFSDRYWCQPVITLHKTSPGDMVDVWKWEFGRRKHQVLSFCPHPTSCIAPKQAGSNMLTQRPLLYSDYWHFHHPGTSEALENWDNGDWDSSRSGPEEGIDSPEKCAEACQREDGCVQWNWRGRDEEQCILARSFRYGEARGPEQKDGKWVDFKSGWLGDRIEQWRKERPCDVVEWVGPSIKRVF
ncbi:glycosyltransferase family 31 [Trichoderma cornu-damae]|uniref:N-acetylgalactosaminide beta-1,3-galactosyltransferase n=1 Tax=Trichoderma cornu-damae TaxID=654480 RepID=A0A9P8QGL3_9HYPO|nr:glycosyltransferase family 31 [Trichoderma cornu-damae]